MFLCVGGQNQSQEMPELFYTQMEKGEKRWQMK